DIHNAISGIPYEHIIILANTDEYGGGGIYNSYTLTTARHKNFRPVVVHEFGHSFGGLADEYFYEQEQEESYPLDVEPWEPNITTLVDFDSKWKHLVKEETPVPTPEKSAAIYPVGVYEGGGYTFKGVYRPADRCRMRDNDWPVFCPACEEALANLIDFYAGE
ncbi:MAG: M64 family metallopeptidase, partial [Duncaniella sp.]|nr:M64 family metallopeptidase [Duncaniella sp.]